MHAGLLVADSYASTYVMQTGSDMLVIRMVMEEVWGCGWFEKGVG
jgi:hypothetical protein